jgi:hypothetical protein
MKPPFVVQYYLLSTAYCFYNASTSTDMIPQGWAVQLAAERFGNGEILCPSHLARNSMCPFVMAYMYMLVFCATNTDTTFLLRRGTTWSAKSGFESLLVVVVGCRSNCCKKFGQAATPISGLTNKRTPQTFYPRIGKSVSGCSNRSSSKA